MHVYAYVCVCMREQMSAEAITTAARLLLFAVVVAVVVAAILC